MKMSMTAEDILLAHQRSDRIIVDMAIYLLSKDSDDDVVNLAKEKVGHVIPDIIPISSLDVLEDATSRLTREKIYVLLMGRRIDQSHLGHFLERAGEYRGRVLFIVIATRYRQPIIRRSSKRVSLIGCR